MKHVTALLLSLFINSVFSQSNPILKEFYSLVYQAKKYYYSRDYQAALDTYEKALKIYPYKFYPAENYVYAGCSAIELKQYRKGTSYLKKAILNGGSTINGITDQEGLKELLSEKLEDSDLYFKSKYWLNLVKQENQLLHKFFKTIDSNLYAKIKSMYDKDQHIRKITDGWTREIAIVDSLNWNELRVIIKDNSWPGRQKIGTRGAFYSDLLLNHSGYAGSSFIKFIEPVAKQAVFKGELKPFSYAFWIDRRKKHILFEQQLYGTCVSPNKPIEEQVKLDGLNKRREEIMLPELDNLK